jgi:hypothetical protein
MNEALETLRSLDQDGAIVALFTVVLVFSAVALVGVAVLRSLGRWGRVALFASVAVVAVVWMLK